MQTFFTLDWLILELGILGERHEDCRIDADIILSSLANVEDDYRELTRAWLVLEIGILKEKVGSLKDWRGHDFV